MTWKDKFAIFCVKGERLIVKNKKKRIIGLIILVLIILTACIFIFGHNHINSQKNEKKSLETKSDINKNTKKEKVETIKEEEEQQEEIKEEELEENKKRNKTVEENKSSQKTTTILIQIQIKIIQHQQILKIIIIINSKKLSKKHLSQL